MPSHMNLAMNVLSIGVEGAGAGAAPALDLPAPTSFWQMNGTTVEMDTVGPNVLAASASIPGSAAGKVGLARQFVAASTQYLTANDQASLQLNTASSLAFWVYLTSKTTSRILVFKGNNQSTAGLEYEFRFDQPDNRFEFEFCTTTLGDFTGWIQSNPQVNTWYCLAAKWDGTNVYTSVNGGAFTPAAAAGLPRTTAGPFRLGVGDTAVGQYHDGLLDAVSLWKGVLLTNAQVANFYNLGLGAEYASGAWQPVNLPAPTSFWRMAGGASANESDTGGALTLTQMGGVGTGAGVIGTARTFAAASNQYFTCADAPGLRLDTPSTIAGWFRLTTKTTYRMIFFKGTNGSGAGGQDYQMYFNSAANYMQVSIYDVGGSTYTNYPAGAGGGLSNPAINTWYAFCAKWDGAQLSLAFNGGPFFSINAPLPKSSAGSFYLGNRELTSSLPLDGLLDAVGIWKGVAFTDVQWANFYNGGVGREFNLGAWS
jgi:hypothetical protein